MKTWFFIYELLLFVSFIVMTIYDYLHGNLMWLLLDSLLGWALSIICLVTIQLKEYNI